MAGIRHASLDTAVDRLLTPVAPPAERPKAIFRVVPAAEAFQFTRRLFGAASSGLPVIERFGPFESERAAHTLAKRAAARFLAERPQFVVGVIGLADEDRPQASGRFRAEGFAPGEACEQPKCEECGKPTRFYQGKPVRFCPTPPGGPRSLCLIRHSNRISRAKEKTDPIAKKKRSLRQYKYLRNNPVRWEKHLEKNRALKAKQRGRKTSFNRFQAEEAALGVAVDPPKCVTCGKETRFNYGKPQLYCSRVDGRNRCYEIAREKRISADPSLVAARLKKCRERYHRMVATPEGRERMRQKWRAGEGRRQRQRGRSGGSEPTGSVLVTASPRGDGYDLFSRIHAAVPSNMPPSLRAEIISETAVLVLEGAEIPAAVTQATKSVRKNGSRLRWAKPIEDCFWLADETQHEMEHC